MMRKQYQHGNYLSVRMVTMVNTHAAVANEKCKNKQRPTVFFSSYVFVLY